MNAFRLSKPALSLPWLVVGLLIPWTADLAAERAKPSLNVLLIAVDDLRDTLGCYGNKAVKTPNIDRLAAQSVLFERAYVQYPVCNPSRVSFLTGLRPGRTGVTDNRTLLRDKFPRATTFPQLLKQNGWHTESIGKIFHLGGGRDPALRAQWMDLPFSWHRARRFEPTERGRQSAAGRNLTGGALRWCRWAAAKGDDDDQPDGQNASAAIEFLEQPPKSPWLLAVGFHKPHDPFVAPEPYFDLYPKDSLELYRDPADMTPAPPLAVGFGGFGRAFDKFSDAERLEFLRAYYACTSFMDAQVGRLLETLDRLGLRQRTMVIFLSDHGYHLGERDWWNKNTLFDRSCRAPLLIDAPGVTPGIARGLVEFVDLFPTIVDYCGLQPPAGLAGRSLRPLLEHPDRPGKEAARTMVTRGPRQRGDSIRTDRWRYTEWSDGSSELYDHADDPEETRNVVQAHPQVVRTLQHKLNPPTP